MRCESSTKDLAPLWGSCARALSASAPPAAPSADLGDGKNGEFKLCDARRNKHKPMHFFLFICLFVICTYPYPLDTYMCLLDRMFKLRVFDNFRVALRCASYE